ncbi:MAG TPA: glycosyl hydrolase, partial [Vicinamibacteria bacterium]
AEKGGLFRSDDGGESFARVNDHRALQQRAWYYTHLTVDPVNADVVWFPQVPLLKTVDGGKTVKHSPGYRHGDNHDLWIDPKDPRRMILANDGGVEISVNAGESWRAAWLPISQFYHVATDNSVPYKVSGAMQDLGTAWGPSDSLDKGGIRVTDWHGIGGGEAGYTAHDAKDPGVVYAGEYLGIFTRYDHRTRQARNVSPYPNNLSGHGSEEGRYRFQWTAPIVVSPHEAKTVYYGGNVVFRTADGGQTWAVISPDLTRDDKSKQKWTGGPITGDNTGVEHYSTVFALAESPKQQGVLWAGSDDGRVHVSKDAGASWTNVTAGMPGFPEWGTVSLIEASPHDAATAYVVVDNHRLDDMRPYLWKTADFGRTWKRLGPGLPGDVYLHAVREDPVRKGLLYLGTERGVSYSTDDGASFTSLKLNLPTVAVHDLQVKGNDLVVGTHGRSIWIFGHLAVLRALGPEVLAKEVQLFTPAAATRFVKGEALWGEKGQGENPPRGALVHYFLKKKPEGEITLEVLDARGVVLRRLTNKPEPNEWPEGDPDGGDEEKPYALPAETGVNAAVWDLTLEGTRPIAKARIDSGNPREGPLALPGAYNVRLSVAGLTTQAPLEVRPDPRSGLSAADLQEQMDFVLGLRDDLQRLSRTVEQVRSVRDQLRSRNVLLAQSAGASELVKAGAALADKCDDLEGRMHNPSAQVSYDILAMKGGARLYSRLAPLYSWALEGEGRPTQGMKEMAAEHRKELEGLLAEWRSLVAGEIAALNAKARELSLGFVLVDG